MQYNQITEQYDDTINQSITQNKTTQKHQTYKRML